MTIYTDEQARQQLDVILKTATSDGEVRIRAKNGQEYALRPVAAKKRPRYPRRSRNRTQRSLKRDGLCSSCRFSATGINR